MKFFCPQCRAEREVEDFQEFRTKRNRKMAKTSCPICGLQIYKNLETSLGKTSKD
jgi:transcription elongation factor Elf1